MADSTPAEHCRDMSKFEQIFAKHRINNCGTMLEIDVKDGHKVDMMLLRKAVKETQLRHPQLRMCHDFKETTLRTKPVSQENFQVLTEMTDTWEEFMRKMVNEDYIDENCKVSAFRVLAYEESPTLLRLFIAFQHSLADGLARMNIVKDILSAYKNLNADTNFHHKYLQPIPLLIEKTFPNGLTEEETKTMEKFAEKENEIMMSSKLHLSLPTIGAKPGDSTIYYEGSPDKMKILRDVCHREKTTIGSLALAASAFAMAKMKKKALTSDILYPINLRTRINLEEFVGFHVVAPFLRQKIDLNTNLWELTRQNSSFVKDFIDSGCHLLRPVAIERGMLKMNESIEMAKKQLCGDDESKYNFDGRSIDLCTSNHGVWTKDVLDHGVLSVRKVNVSGARWSSFGNALVLMIHSINNISYSLVHRDDPICYNEAKELLDNFISILEDAERLNSEYNFQQFLNE